MSDSCCSTDDSVCFVQNFIECNNIKYVLYKNFKHKINSYDYPFNSELLNIVTVSNLSSELQYTSINKIKYKCMLIPYRTKVFSFPLYH